jgi:Flp pilus assembly protein protease CpaA
MLVIVAPVLAWIAISDLHFHRIPNRALVLLSLPSFIYSTHSGYIWQNQILVACGALSGSLLLWRFSSLGMGDVKLLSLMALFLIPASVDSYCLFLTFFSIFALIHLVAQAQILRSMRYPLPLAPSLVLAYIWMAYLK